MQHMTRRGDVNSHLLLCEQMTGTNESQWSIAVFARPMHIICHCVLTQRRNSSNAVYQHTWRVQVRMMIIIPNVHSAIYTAWEGAYGYGKSMLLRTACVCMLLQ